MRIKLDKKHYLIGELGFCWIVCETKSKSGKSSERCVSGYVPTFEMAVESYINRKINGSNASEIAQLAKEVEELKAEVRGWKVSLEEGTEDEKQIPMEVTEVHVDEYYCPACGAENGCCDGKVEDNYCPRCGQALR